MTHILRLPRMTSIFQSAMRKHKDAEEMKKYEQVAIDNLSGFIDKSNEA